MKQISFPEAGSTARGHGTSSLHSVNTTTTTWRPQRPATTTNKLATAAAVETAEIAVTAKTRDGPATGTEAMVQFDKINYRTRQNDFSPPPSSLPPSLPLSLHPSLPPAPCTSRQHDESSATKTPAKTTTVRTVVAGNRISTATHYNTLQHTASLCNKLVLLLQVLLSRVMYVGYISCNTVCNTLQHTATYCNILQHTAIHCSVWCSVQ